MLEKLKFRVISSSSDQCGFPGIELEKHGPCCNGWRSDKSPQYPQEIILQLECRSRIGHIQLLSHQYLIPEKIEICIGEFLGEKEQETSLKTEAENTQFMTLGHVILSSNEETGFKAREMKSISVNCKAEMVKIVLHNNYKNKYNRHNQVALVAINLLGEKLDDDDEMTKSMSSITFEETSYSDRDRNLLSPYDDLSFIMYVDLEVQEVIKKLDYKKQQAVLDERFDFASKLKASIEQLKKSGELLAKYQLEKQIAASREDFEKAKEKKIQADNYRANAYKSLRVNELLEPNGRNAQNDEPGKVPSVSGIPRSLTHTVLPTAPISGASTPESTTSERFSARLHSGNNTPDHEKKESGYYSNDEPKFPPVYVKKRSRPNTAERSRYQSKEMTAMTKSICITQRSYNISERARRYATLSIQVFGDSIVDKFFSKNFAMKEEGLRSLHQFLQDYKKGDKTKTEPASKVFRAAIVLLQRSIKDTVFGVFNLTAHVFIYLMDDFCRKHRMATSEMSQGLENMFPELISASGDGTVGKSKVAKDTIIRLQSVHHIRALNIISFHLTKPLDSPVHPKVAQSKAELVEELLKTYGLSADKHSGLTPRDYVEFGVSAINQPSESVRRIADRIIITMYHTHPKLVRQNLPLEQNVSPKNVHYRQLFSQFDEIDKEKIGTCMITSIMKDSKSNSSLTASVYVPKV